MMFRQIDKATKPAGTPYYIRAGRPPALHDPGAKIGCNITGSAGAPNCVEAYVADDNNNTVAQFALVNTNWNSEINFDNVPEIFLNCTTAFAEPLINIINYFISNGGKFVKGSVIPWLITSDSAQSINVRLRAYATNIPNDGSWDIYLKALDQLVDQCVTEYENSLSSSGVQRNQKGDFDNIDIIIGVIGIAMFAVLCIVMCYRYHIRSFAIFRNHPEGYRQMNEDGPRIHLIGPQLLRDVPRSLDGQSDVAPINGFYAFFLQSVDSPQNEEPSQSVVVTPSSPRDFDLAFRALDKKAIELLNLNLIADIISLDYQSRGGCEKALKLLNDSQVNSLEKIITPKQDARLLSELARYKEFASVQCAISLLTPQEMHGNLVTFTAKYTNEKGEIVREWTRHYDSWAILQHIYNCNQRFVLATAAVNFDFLANDKYVKFTVGLPAHIIDFVAEARQLLAVAAFDNTARLFKRKRANSLPLINANESVGSSLRY